MKIKGYLAFILILVLGFSSCVTNKKTTYHQQLEQSDIPQESVTPEVYRVLPTDNLYIKVITPNPKWSEIFNTVQSGGTSSMTESSANLISYSVNYDGTIDFPYVGTILVGGKNLREIREVVEYELNDYIDDVAVTVKLVSSTFSVLGEVKQPGKYPIDKNHLNIFQALAMAGDMSVYGNRTKVKVIRQTVEGPITLTFDLRDERIVGSEYYYVMPNDVIYAEPMKGKFFKLESFPYALIFTTLSAAVLIMNLVK